MIQQEYLLSFHEFHNLAIKDVILMSFLKEQLFQFKMTIIQEVIRNLVR